MFRSIGRFHSGFGSLDIHQPRPSVGRQCEVRTEWLALSGQIRNSDLKDRAVPVRSGTGDNGAAKRSAARYDRNVLDSRSIASADRRSLCSRDGGE